MIYLELFYVFFLIGLFTFGGGYAMIPLIESETVTRGWITEETFYNVVSIAESTPGPIAINMATFVGNIQGGVLGSIIATVGVILPSFIIILLIATVLNRIMDNKIVKAILNGFKAVVIGLILSTAFVFLLEVFIVDFKCNILDFVAIIIFGVLIVISFVYKKIKKKAISPYLLLIVSGVLGLVLYYIESVI